MGLGLQIWERCCLAGRADVEAAGAGQAGGSARAEGEVAVPKVCICLPGEVQKKSLKCCIKESGSPAVRLGDDKWIDLSVCSKELQARSAARGDLSMLSPPTDFLGFQIQALCLMEPVRVWSQVYEDSLLPGFCLSPISGSLPDCSFPCAHCRHSWNKVGFAGDGYARVATFFLEKKSCLGPELFRRKLSQKYFKCDAASSKAQTPAWGAERSVLLCLFTAWSSALLREESEVFALQIFWRPADERAIRAPWFAFHLFFITQCFFVQVVARRGKQAEGC